MEGLIKGLIDVALGRDDGGEDETGTQPHHHRQGQHHDTGERSRSTWAEVVSSGQQDKSHSNYSNHQASSWSSSKEESGGGDAGDWEVATGHKKKHNAPHDKVPVENWHEYKRPPSEQSYLDYVQHGVDTDPSEEELDDLSKACNRLWELDLNRLVPGKDYEIDLAEGKKVYQKGDMAEGSLFKWLDNGVFSRPTYARFCSLLDNYNPHEGYKEVVSSEEKHEQTAFIEEISRTAPIKYLHRYLVMKGIASENYDEFKRMMKNLWFDLYGRGGGSSCSSAFEHVFVGEIKGGRGENEVSGFHNWIQFYMEEAKGRVDYQGYILPRRCGEHPDSETQLLSIQFEWNGMLKAISSSLVGVSPEFEIAVYTLCFFVGGEDNHVVLGPYPLNIKCYRLGRDKIGSVFPIAES